MFKMGEHLHAWIIPSCQVDSMGFSLQTMDPLVGPISSKLASVSFPLQ